ncbi:hypothetical protein DSO57_1015659 [Entomophthora muscae]|uniref:Uncharacterized protein n=1 Tax=Entomophthora muscae TaxID=34485 RepID=A0ACC2UDZ2_9FUNG|nr:hypothetical protein DSO57_1015659 [Entomophthora muscae]
MKKSVTVRNDNFSISETQVIYQFKSNPSGPPPATYCLTGAPFGPVHFTEYPLNPEYRYYSSEKILAQDLLALSKELTRYNIKGPWYINESRLFKDKYSFISAYQLDMKLPITPKPMPMPATELPLDHSNIFFGIVYITLAGVINTIIPAARL